MTWKISLEEKAILGAVNILEDETKGSCHLSGTSWVDNILRGFVTTSQ